MLEGIKKILTEKLKNDNEEKEEIKKRQSLSNSDKGILNDKIRALELQKEIITQDYQKEIETLKQKINELNEKLNEINTDKKNNTESNAKLNQEIENLNEKIKKNEIVIKELRDKYDSENQIKIILNENIKKLNEKIKALEIKNKEENESKVKNEKIMKIMHLPFLTEYGMNINLQGIIATPILSVKTAVL